jgi:hypothetical protein
MITFSFREYSGWLFSSKESYAINIFLLWFARNKTSINSSSIKEIITALYWSTIIRFWNIFLKFMNKLKIVIFFIKQFSTRGGIKCWNVVSKTFVSNLNDVLWSARINSDQPCKREKSDICFPVLFLAPDAFLKSPRAYLAPKSKLFPNCDSSQSNLKQKLALRFESRYTFPRITSFRWSNLFFEKGNNKSIQLMSLN